MTATIKIGTGTVHTVPITGQSHARLRHLIPKILSGDQIAGLTDAVASGDEDQAQRQIAAAMAGYAGKAYDLLVVLAPALAHAVPEHVWQGFGSPEAQAAGEYVEAHDHAPSLDQIVDAFEVALEVNGLKKLGDLLKLAGTASQAIGGPGNPPA